MRRLAALGILAAALTGVSAGSATTRSGLYGKVVIDPARPVCQPSLSCSSPDGNDLLAFSRRGRRVATTRTRKDGAYGLALAPGRYTVTLPRRSGEIGRGLSPAQVTVPRGRYARVSFTLDIGIR